MQAHEKYVIYGLSCACHPADGIRYIGKTSRGLHRRFSEHRRDALRGDMLPVHAWMREHEVVASVLATAADASSLEVAEIRAIARARGEGVRLLNVAIRWAVRDGIWT